MIINIINDLQSTRNWGGGKMSKDSIPRRQKYKTRTCLTLDTHH